MVYASVSSYAQTQSVVTKTIKPAGWSDIAVVNSEHIKGGVHTVATLDDRDKIPEQRRSFGMMCYVEDKKSIYQLQKVVDNVMDDSNWVEIQLVATTRAIDKILVSQADGVPVWKDPVKYEELAVVNLKKDGEFDSPRSTYSVVKLEKESEPSNPSILDFQDGGVKVGKSGLYNVFWSAENGDGSVDVKKSNDSYVSLVQLKGLFSKSAFVSLEVGDVVYLKFKDFKKPGFLGFPTFLKPKSIRLTVAQYVKTDVTTPNLESVLVRGAEAKGQIKKLSPPTDVDDAANKEYVDNQYVTLVATNGVLPSNDEYSQYCNFRLNFNNSFTLINPTIVKTRTYTWIVKNISTNSINISFGDKFIVMQGSGTNTLAAGKVALVVGMADSSTGEVFYSIAKQK